jgi:hypothetical protein
MKKNIKWDNNDIIFTRKYNIINEQNQEPPNSNIKIDDNKCWLNSTTLLMKTNNFGKNDEYKSIGEFQMHSKRKNFVWRWKLENILTMFPDNFEVKKWTS